MLGNDVGDIVGNIDGVNDGISKIYEHISKIY